MNLCLAKVRFLPKRGDLFTLPLFSNQAQSRMPNFQASQHYRPQEDAEPLLIDRSHPAILRLTMNRPAVYNAFDDQQILRLTQLLQTTAADPSIRLVILGSTGQLFCAGGDLNYMRRMGTLSYEENLADAAQLAELMRSLASLPQPTIARVQGAAYGGGVGLISCCDFAIATPYAKLALSEVKLGIAPATIGPYVVRSIGEKAARRMFISGQTVEASKAEQLGFYSDLVPADQLDTAIEALCEAILSNGPAAIQAAKKLAGAVASGPVSSEMIAATVRQIADMRDSAEGREGMGAFLEKRKPNWQLKN